MSVINSNNIKAIETHSNIGYLTERDKLNDPYQGTSNNISEYNKQKFYNNFRSQSQKKNGELRQDANQNLNLTQLTFTMEVCKNCPKHMELHEQFENPQEYTQYSEKVINLLGQMFPKCKVIKVKNPRMGAFEIRHMNHLIWSKLLFKKFPDIPSLQNRISNYFRDFSQKQNLSKYEYPDLENPNTIIKQNPKIAQKIYRNVFNGNINSNNAKKQDIIQKKNSIPNILSGNYTQNNNTNNNSSQVVFNSERKIYRPGSSLKNTYYNSSGFIKSSENLSLCSPVKKNKSLRPTTSHNLSSNKTLYRQTTISNIKSSTTIPTQMTDNSSDSNQQNGHNQMEQQLLQQQQSVHQVRSNMSPIKIYNQQQSIELEEQQHEEQQQFEYQANGYTLERLQKQQEIIQKKILQEYQKPQNVMKKQVYDEESIKKEIELFWENYQMYYISFMYNPSIKRISGDISDILVKVQQFMDDYREAYKKQVDQVSKLQEELQNSQQQIKTNLHQYEKIEQEYKQEAQKQREKIQEKNRSIEALELKFNKKCKDMEELEEYNKVIILKSQEEKQKFQEEIKEQKENYEKKIQQIQQTLEEQKKKSSGTQLMKNMQNLGQKNLLEQRQQKIDYLQKMVTEKEEEINKMKRSYQSLKSQNTIAIEEKTNQFSHLEEVVEKLRQENEKKQEKLQTSTQTLEEQLNSIKEKNQELKQQLNAKTRKLDSILDTSYSTLVPKNVIQKIGIFWNDEDFEGDDCDLGCLMINKLGDIDAKIDHSSTEEQKNSYGVSYLGQMEGKIFDRDISISFEDVPDSIHAIGIIIYSRTQNLSALDNCCVNYIVDGYISNHQQVENIKGKSCLLSVFTRNSSNPRQCNTWKFNSVLRPYPNLIFKNLVVDNLSYAGIRLSENARLALKWTENCGKLLKVKAGEKLPVPEAAYENFVVGLGWDTGKEGIDIDASIVMFNKDHSLFDNINYNHLTSKCGSIQHQGDERTGEAEGDDEKICMNLNKIPAEVSYLWIFICISEENKFFNQVEGAYCRFMAKETEFCRFDMTKIKESGRNGILVCDLQKLGQNKWCIKGRNYFTKETFTSDDVIPTCKKVMDGDLSDIKIIDIKNQ